MGKSWYSGLEGSLADMLLEHGKFMNIQDKFSSRSIFLYRNLMWNNIPGIWGYQYTAAEKLSKMAVF